jgi:hypothetical protein
MDLGIIERGANFFSLSQYGRGAIFFFPIGRGAS